MNNITMETNLQHTSY